MPFSSTSLEHTGQALFGPNWKEAFANALQVKERTLRRWLADPGSIPQGIEIEIRELCVERVKELNRAILQMETGGIEREP